MEEFKEKPFKDDWYFEKLKVFMKVYGIEMSKVFDTKEDKSNVFGFDKRSVFGRNNLNLLFGRKEFALNLEKIIKNIDKNENVIAIHSEFGTGKSYFANEFNFELTNEFELLNKPKREIEFWSKCVDEWTEN